VTTATCAAIVALILLADVAGSQSPPADVDGARARAIAASRPLAVFCTGSDWDAASETVVKELQKARFLEPVAASHELAHVDLAIASQDSVAVTARDRAATTLRQLGVWRFDQLPCVIFFDSRGVVRGRSLLPAKLERAHALLREIEAASRHALAPGPEPGRAAAHVQTGWSLLQQKKIAEARAEAVAALADDASQPGVWDLLTVTAPSAAKSEKVAAARAAVALTVVSDRDSGTATALAAQRWLRLGEALAEQKREAEALFCYRQAMATDRAHVAAGLAAAMLCQQLADPAGAVRDADEVLRRDFGNAEALRVRSRNLPARVIGGR